MNAKTLFVVPGKTRSETLKATGLAANLLADLAGDHEMVAPVLPEELTLADYSQAQLADLNEALAALQRAAAVVVPRYSGSTYLSRLFADMAYQLDLPRHEVEHLREKYLPDPFAAL